MAKVKKAMTSAVSPEALATAARLLRTSESLCRQAVSVLEVHTGKQNNKQLSPANVVGGGCQGGGLVAGGAPRKPSKSA
eukprot:1713688-Karenia_brevis.AAC.1